MKIFLPFKQDEKKYHENARVWHNLCRTCDFLHLERVKQGEDYDILHLVNTLSENLVDEALLRKKPIIITALCAESDASAMLVEKDGYYSLKAKAVRVLNKATLIIVPSELARIIMKHAGVEKPIYVLSEGVDVHRFENIKNNLEMSLFSRYFEVKNDNPVVISTGTYEEKSGIMDYVELAKRFPKVNFFWFGRYQNYRVKRNIKKLMKHHPKNLWLENIVDENVFLSALIHASVYCVTGTTIVGTVTILDALVSGCQIVAREKALLLDNISQHKNTFMCKSFRDLCDKMNIVLGGERKEQKDELEKIIEKYSIETIAPELYKIYQLVLDIANNQIK